MQNGENVDATIGTVSGPYQPEYLVCQNPHKVSSKGIWFSDDPLAYTMPLLMFQIISLFVITRSIHFLLKPLRPSLFIIQVVAGIIIGPSVLGQNPGYLETMFPPIGILMLETLSRLGFMIHLFMLGIQVDTSIFKNPGRSAVFVGTMSFLFPYTLGFLAIYTLNKVGSFDGSTKNSLYFIAMINSASSFPVITSHLRELRILNSEIGRLASNAALVCELWAFSISLSVNSFGIALRISKWDSFLSLLSLGSLLALILFILRPAIIWLSKRSHGGESIGESHFVVLMVVVFSTGLLFEVFGQQSSFGVLLLGLALPEGPPLGTSLVNKIEAISAGLLVPAFTTMGGMRTNLTFLGGRSSMFLLLLIMTCYIAKFCGTLLSAIYCRFPFQDAVTLALIMCCKGIIEVAVYVTWKDWMIISNQTFAHLMITMLIITVIARPIIAYLYDPSRRYAATNRRSILQSGDDAHLNLLVCIHSEDNVPIILNLLEASNPTPYSPISVFTLCLQELKGRAAAVLVPQHHLSRDNDAASSEHIINAFEHFEQLHGGSALVQHYTSIAPYVSMHDDVCTLAMEKRITIIILPFHKQWAIDGTVGFTKHRIRNVNRNVMSKAPCSVGVLVDRANIGGAKPAFMKQPSSSYRVGMLFLGGPDDREALAFCHRMANHPRVVITVVWVKKAHHYDGLNDDYEDMLDEEFMNEFKATYLSRGGRSGLTYREETVKDGVETTEVICSLEGLVDLLLVGRYHNLKSPVMSGIADWSECPELGVIGDMLATSDFKFSVLVVQQQPVEPTGVLNQVYSEPKNNPIETFRSEHSCSFPNSDDQFSEFGK